jgi:hypothetical protein
MAGMIREFKPGIMAKLGLIFHHEQHSVEIWGTTRIIYKKGMIFPSALRKTTDH